MVDQDLSLFHDTAPLFCVSEFSEPMPDSDALWSAKSAQEWSSIFEQVHEFSSGYSSVGSGARPLSLRDLFKHFLDDAIISQGIELTPLHLRLLLHPLQLLVSQYRQLLSCFSDPLASGTSSHSRSRSTFSAASTNARLEELQQILTRWYHLADRYMKANPMCPLMQVSLTMFHLVALNAVSNLPEIEKLARREDVDGSFQGLISARKRCLTDPQQAVFHAGQVMRHVRAMPRGIRPPWWAASVYRAGLVLWADGLTNPTPSSPSSSSFPGLEHANTFSIDVLAPDHPVIVRWLSQPAQQQQAAMTPALTKRDGSFLTLGNPFAVLFHCVDVIGEGVATRFTDGIKGKMERLAKGTTS